MNRIARLAAVVLGAGLVAGTSPRPEPAAASMPNVTVSSDGDRLIAESPFIHLEINLLQPAIDVLRLAPAGDRNFGASLGEIIEEAAVGERVLRSSTDDPDGAQASWLASPDSVLIRLEGLDLGPAAKSSWILTLSDRNPSFRLDRVTTPQVDSGLNRVGLAITSPTVYPNVNPASLARMVNEGSYRAEVGPPVLEQAGGLLGLLAVDHPELSFSARTDQPDRVVARHEGQQLTLAFARQLESTAPQTRESVTFRFGWANDYLEARSEVAPEVESRLLAAGYYGNAVITQNLGTVLSASMRDYRGSVWSRDFDYALQGYSLVLDDVSTFRNTLERFLERIDERGVAPEYILLNGQYGNRESWDSMANVIQATYTYVAKTGDLELFKRHEPAIKRAMQWIRGLDTDDDGLPDRDVFPYGYTDTVENGPMHTYALAKHYSAALALAELEEAIGQDGQQWREYASLMQQGFAKPLSEGGYWNPETGYPIAWKRASGQVFKTFETFGVFEAIRVGLLTEPQQMRSVGAFMDANRGAFLNGNAYPERLMIGGYELGVKKAEVPMEKLWILDCNAPWITGISVPARVKLGRLRDAHEMFEVYVDSANRSIPHAEFGAGPEAVFGPGETEDGGRLWENWSFFSAVYGTHFGVKMTIPALEISPAPLDPSLGRHASGLSYQGARFEVELLDDGYRLSIDAPRDLVLHPPYGYRAIDINGDGEIQPVRSITAEAGQSYVIRAYR